MAGMAEPPDEGRGVVREEQAPRLTGLSGVDDAVVFQRHDPRGRKLPPYPVVRLSLCVARSTTRGRREDRDDGPPGPGPRLEAHGMQAGKSRSGSAGPDAGPVSSGHAKEAAPSRSACRSTASRATRSRSPSCWPRTARRSTSRRSCCRRGPGPAISSRSRSSGTPGRPGSWPRTTRLVQDHLKKTDPGRGHPL